MLALSHRVLQKDRLVRESRWGEKAHFMGCELRERTLGIIGLGGIGRTLVDLVRGLGMNPPLAFDPLADASRTAALGVSLVPLDRLLRESDFVSINCPLTDETRGMVGAPQYALMKPTAYLVTTARGSIHDEDALAEALRANKIAGAGLDVWEKEPPPLDHPLLHMDNVIVTPHTAGVTREARENMGRIAAEQMLAALDGKPVARVLNPEVWPRYAARFKETFGFAPQGGSDGGG